MPHTHTHTHQQKPTKDDDIMTFNESWKQLLVLVYPFLRTTFRHPLNISNFQINLLYIVAIGEFSPPIICVALSARNNIHTTSAPLWEIKIFSYQLSIERGCHIFQLNIMKQDG